MNARSVVSVIIMMITLVTATLLQQVYAAIEDGAQVRSSSKALPASSVTSGDNVYIVWASNKSGHPDVMFRASTDRGQTFNDKINLSNSSGSDSTDAAISAEGGSIIVTWWETNETSQEPLVRTSGDFGAAFGPIMNLAANGTIGPGRE